MASNEINARLACVRLIILVASVQCPTGRVVPIYPRVNAADDLSQKTEERHAKTGFTSPLVL
jgi:hypothetical protein